MAWKPISRDELDAKVAAALASADDAVRAAWERIRIPPEKWRCSPWADAGGGFWVVGVGADFVVWFNDIEDGFNTSPLETRGVIAKYACNQSDFSELLQTLPEARTAEEFARSEPTSIMPAHLRGPGRIGRRQTTYWEIHPAPGAAARVHFTGKKEMRFAGSAYDSVDLAGEHPLLVQYVEGWQALYIAGAAKAPASIVEALAERVRTGSKGWRQVEEYLGQGGPTESVLREGHGLLLRAPRSVVQIAAEVLRAFGVSPSIIDGWQPRGSYRVLLLGGSFVIAKAFRFETLGP